MYFCVNLQVCLGIYSVTEQVPVNICVMHLTNALISLSFVLALLNSVKRPNARFLTNIERIYMAKNAKKIGNL